MRAKMRHRSILNLALLTAGTLSALSGLLIQLLFAIAAAEGLAAWAVSGLTHVPFLRHLLVETHDKLTLLLIVLLVVHVWKRKRRIWRAA
jgi:hypothetical protein